MRDITETIAYRNLRNKLRKQSASEQNTINVKLLDYIGELQAQINQLHKQIDILKSESDVHKEDDMKLAVYYIEETRERLMKIADDFATDLRSEGIDITGLCMLGPTITTPHVHITFCNEPMKLRARTFDEVFGPDAMKVAQIIRLKNWQEPRFTGSLLEYVKVMEGVE